MSFAAQTKGMCSSDLQNEIDTHIRRTQPLPMRPKRIPLYSLLGRRCFFFFNSLSICFFQSFHWWYQIDSGIQWIPLTPFSPPLFPLSETLNPNTTWRELSSKRTDLHKFVTALSTQPTTKKKQPLPNKLYKTQTWKTGKLATRVILYYSSMSNRPTQPNIQYNRWYDIPSLIYVCNKVEHPIWKKKFLDANKSSSIVQKWTCFSCCCWKTYGKNLRTSIPSKMMLHFGAASKF